MLPDSADINKRRYAITKIAYIRTKSGVAGSSPVFSDGGIAQWVEH